MKLNEVIKNLENKFLVLDTWAGRRFYPVRIVGETPKKMRIRILSKDGVMLPNRRYVQNGEIVLVPKHAICDERPINK